MECYKNCKIYGPYLRKDNRKHLVVVFPDKSKKTVSYPRFVLEKSIGRYLKKGEDAHHKDGDFTNDNPDNLECVVHEHHSRSHHPPTLPEKVSCVYCGRKYTLTGKQVVARRRERKRGKNGPFCSRTCSGKYGRRLQLRAKKETS